MMDMKEWIFTLAVGVTAGAIAVLMLPKQNPARKFARKAADAVEDTVDQVSELVEKKLDCCN